MSQLERWRLGRVPATAIVVLLGFSIIAAVGWFAASQAVSLAAKLPEYRENITAKIRALRAPSEGKLGQAAEAIRDLEEEAAPDQPPLAVRETAATPLAELMEWVTPFAKPLGIALAVIIFTILMLLNREDMRDRVIGLIGAGRINLTTQAFGEASERVSRYLFMQLVVNAGFGIPFGIALYFIGIPNAMLWGLLATLLRFIPYAGIWIAIAIPLTLAFAISDGWSLVAWMLGVFVVLELVFVYGIEPYLYGRSTGLSPIAIIAAVIFWTWLWGPVGLLLATPLTVCVAVMGRYIPEFGFLNVLLGVEPVLPPEGRLYQRLIALDDEEAIDVSRGIRERAWPARATPGRHHPRARARRAGPPPRRDRRGARALRVRHRAQDYRRCRGPQGDEGGGAAQERGRRTEAGDRSAICRSCRPGSAALASRDSAVHRRGA